MINYSESFEDKIINSSFESKSSVNQQILKSEESKFFFKYDLDLQEIFSKCLSKTVSSRNSLGFSDQFFKNKNNKERNNLTDPKKLVDPRSTLIG